MRLFHYSNNNRTYCSYILNYKKLRINITNAYIKFLLIPIYNTSKSVFYKLISIAYAARDQGLKGEATIRHNYLRV